MTVTSLKEKRLEKQGRLYASCPVCKGMNFALVIDPAKAEEEGMLMYVTEVECLGCNLDSITGDGTEYDIVFQPDISDPYP